MELLYNNNGEWSRTFPAGSKIGFVLLVDAWEKNQVTTTTNVMYSHKKYNAYNLPGVFMADRPQMAAFSANGNFILTFEDLPWSDSPTAVNPGDFSDDVFILMANPDTALPDVDEGIEDPDKPVGQEVMNKGVLAFEDLWPYKGDYDMNDIVLKYKSTAYITPDMYIDGIVSTWTFCNNGGQYVNGFGISYDFPASAVQSIKIQATNGVVAPGIESQTGAGYQLLLFNNAAEIPSGTEFTIQIKFNKSALDLIRDQKKVVAPFNPFITARSKADGLTDIPRKEVHLTNYKPTPFAISYNGTYGDDLSDPAKNLYYVAATGYPFAIDLAGIDEFKFPVERECISDAYPRFTRWVESDRKENKDWYLK